MKSIALLKSHFKNQGGLEKYTDRLAREFARRGLEVSILTSNPAPISENPSIRFIPFSIPKWPSFIRMDAFDKKCEAWIKKHKPDIVFGLDRNRHQTHIRAGNGVHRAFLDSRMNTEGIPKKVLCSINPHHRKILILEKCAFESQGLKKLFTNSYIVKSQILHYYRTDPKKISVMHNGVEWQEMEHDFSIWEEKKKEMAHKWKLDPEAFHFLFVGSGFLRKGLEKLLYALSELPDQNFHLSVLGKDNKVKVFEHLSEKLNLAKKVRFFGTQKNARSFYQLADVLAIPSFYDPFANVTVEALAMGLFVVSSRTNGGSEVLTEENGTVINDLLSQRNMVESLKKAMDRRKTIESSVIIRQSAKHLDFSRQLNALIEETLD